MTKLSGNHSGAVWAFLMVLSLYASLGKAAPAGTATSKLPYICTYLYTYVATTNYAIFLLLFHYGQAYAHA